MIVWRVIKMSGLGWCGLIAFGIGSLREVSKDQ
jgi:hypothetical protein